MSFDWIKKSEKINQFLATHFFTVKFIKIYKLKIKYVQAEYLGHVKNLTDRLTVVNYSKDSKLAPDVQTNGADFFRLSCF